MVRSEKIIDPNSLNNIKRVSLQNIESGRLQDAKMMLEAANAVDYAGADCLLLGANTMHMMADFIAERISIPLIHIGEETAKIINGQGLKKVGLLGTKTTMEKDFYRNKLKQYNIDSVIPGDSERDYINKTIFGEFSKEIFTEEARRRYGEIIDGLI